MHEIRIAEDLSAIVVEAAREANLTTVTKVNVTFGQLVRIVPDIFEFAFREAVRDSVAVNAELEIEIAGVCLQCKRCGNEFNPYDNHFTCDKCGSFEIEILRGKELFVKSIEGE